ncbi:MAG: S9 family peptidase [Bacteroidetes bacterium]|nr:S9 family peptidase [Bacteroidota bacterium]
MVTTRYFKTLCSTLVLALFFISPFQGHAQFGGNFTWAKDGYQYYVPAQGGSAIVEYDMRDSAKKTIVLNREMLTPAGKRPLTVQSFSFSDDLSKVLVFTNTKRVWRFNTIGDYWVYDFHTKKLWQVGAGGPESSLMFAKFSPNGAKVAYVRGHNLFVEDLATGAVTQLTTDGEKKLINGTFDWVYEEEFGCRDGFRWSPDSKSIAYWQVDARKIRNYLMLNTTDSIYPYTVPVEYPVAGQDPSSCRIGVVNISTAKTTWMNVPGDKVQHYIPRMEWALNSDNVMVEQLNRAQTESRIFACNASDGSARLIREEISDTWIDGKARWNGGDPVGWDWLKDGKSFLWVTEKDGWRHLYRITTEGKETLVTRGNYDIITLDGMDAAAGFVYFTASPDNATQAYLYRVKLDGSSSKPERITPDGFPGTHNYTITANGKMAIHYFSNSYTPFQKEVVSLPDHKHVSGTHIALNKNAVNKPEFFKIKTVDNIEMDGFMVKPTHFDSTKKYPVVFFVYAEPAHATVLDIYGAAKDFLYLGNMADDGYIYMAIEGRGTPAPKGAAWLHAIYKNIGKINIRDQAMGCREILKWPFVDSTRIAVFGWSGGGSTTLNLMFQYPELYQTGIAVSAEGWQLSYDNVYQERYMGVPIDSASRVPFIEGSPVTYAKNLRGNLLYMHGTGDDNVHYVNAELLINELIKYNRQFQLMLYPNRSHGIYEGEGTTTFLQTLYTRYLKQYCPPGGR